MSKPACESTSCTPVDRAPRGMVDDQHRHVRLRRRRVDQVAADLAERLALPDRREDALGRVVHAQDAEVSTGSG